MGHHRPPDFARGDPGTIAGYSAVHGRPAAFEGPDGSSYSVEAVSDATGEPARPFGAYLLFVRWASGEPVPAGHLETDYLEFAATEEEALSRVGALQLSAARERLEALVRERGADVPRPWWEGESR